VRLDHIIEIINGWLVLALKIQYRINVKRIVRNSNVHTRVQTERDKRSYSINYSVMITRKCEIIKQLASNWVISDV
jgi:hypothetical protein